MSPTRITKTYDDTSMDGLLKNVFKLYQNETSDLKAKLEEANEKIKSLSTQSTSSCQSCKHLQEMNKTLKSRLRDKDIINKHLESRLKLLGESVPEPSHTMGVTDTVVTAEDDQSCDLEDLDSEVTSTTAHMSNSRLNTKLQLDKHEKRKCRYQETSVAKKQKTSPGPGERNVINKILRLKDLETQTQAVNHTILVQDTVASPDTLVVPESLAMDGEEEEEEDRLSDKDNSDLEESCTLTEANVHLGRKSKSNNQEFNKSKNRNKDLKKISPEHNNSFVPEEENVLPNSRSNKTNNKGQGQTKTHLESQSLQKDNALTKQLSSTALKKSLLINQAQEVYSSVGVKDLNQTTTPNTSALKTPETPASPSPLIFDAVRTAKDKDKTLTPQRTSKVSRLKRKPASDISHPHHLEKDNLKNDVIIKPTFTSKENSSPDKSFKQSTLTQAFNLHKEKTNIVTDVDLKEQEDIAEAIRNSLEECTVMPDSLDVDEDEMDASQISAENCKENISNYSAPGSTQMPVKSSHQKSPTKAKVSHDRSDTLKLKERSPNIPMPPPKQTIRNASAVKSVQKDLFKNDGKSISITSHSIQTQDKSQSILSCRKSKTALQSEKDSSSKKSKSHSPPKGQLHPQQLPKESGRDDRSGGEQLQHDKEDNRTETDLDETIAPHLLSKKGGLVQMLNNPGGSLNAADDSELDFFTLPSLQSVLGTKNTTVCSKKKFDITNISESEGEDDCEDETIAPSPQNSLPGQMSSQFGQSLPSSSRSGNRLNETVRGLRADMDLVRNVNVDIMDSIDQDASSHHHVAQQSLYDSFDRVPHAASPEFAHVAVVRKQSERNKLEGFSCQECHHYYKCSDLSEEEMQKKMQECSRHREKFRAPGTPEHFWTLGFPDTAEDPFRDTQRTPLGVVPRPPRRRRRLEKKF